MSIKIILADDHQLIRESLASLIERQSDMKIVGQAENGHRAVQLALELSPDVVIMDISMPELNGIAATRQITAKCLNTKVIGLSAHSDTEHLIEMLKAGVSGYLLEDCTFEELSGAIRAVAAKQFYLSPSITGSLVRDYVKRLSTDENDNSPYVVLSAREREVLQLVAEGRTSEEVASQLHISVKTVARHRENIMGKLNIHSVAELTKYAVRTGLTAL